MTFECDRPSLKRMATVNHSVLRCFFQRVPEPRDVPVRFTPLDLDVVGHLVGDLDAVRRSHRLECTDAALVAQRQHGDLADLAFFLVGLGDGATVDARRGVAVDALATGEHVQRRLLTSEPRQDAGFDCVEVGHQQAVAGGRHDHRPQGRGQRHHRVAVQDLQQFRVAVFEELHAVVGVVERRAG